MLPCTLPINAIPRHLIELFFLPFFFFNNLSVYAAATLSNFKTRLITDLDNNPVLILQNGPIRSNFYRVFASSSNTRNITGCIFLSFVTTTSRVFFSLLLVLTRHFDKHDYYNCNRLSGIEETRNTVFSAIC